MEYTTLGATGMEVSRICLGTMTFTDGGDGTWDWAIDADESTELIERAIDLGINFVDTANTYSWGGSERVVGEVLRDHGREEFVVASKGYFQMDDDDPNSGGLSRKAIDQQLAASLDRLGMDTLDLYQIHRWDRHTPIRTTMRALDDAVRRGQVRYLGASSMWAWQFATALHTADAEGLERFATMQNHYNLVYREEEREMLPYCRRESIGVLPYSPLARGFLARPHEAMDATVRGERDDYLHSRPYDTDHGTEINERVEELATEYGVTMAQIGIAWLLHKDWVTAPIVGTTSVEHLEEAVEALEIDLGDSDLAYLEEPYEPVAVSGHGDVEQLVDI